MDPGRVDHVVDDDGDLVAHVADEVHGLGAVVLGAHLGEHGQPGARQAADEALGELDAAGVGRDGHERRVAEVFVTEVVGQHGHGRHMVDGDLEEALDLALVQVHGEHAVDARGLEQGGDEPRGDRLAGGALLVLPGVRVVRHDRGDAPRGGELRRLDHDEQLHDLVVQPVFRRLHDEGVGPPDALVVARVDLAVGEGLEQHAAQVDAQLLGDLLAEHGVAASREDHEALLRGGHTAGSISHHVPFLDGLPAETRLYQTGDARPEGLSGRPPPTALCAAAPRGARRSRRCSPACRAPRRERPAARRA